MKLFLSCNAKEKTNAQKICKKGKSSPLTYLYSDTGRVADNEEWISLFPRKERLKINERNNSRDFLSPFSVAVFIGFFTVSDK